MVIRSFTDSPLGRLRSRHVVLSWDGCRDAEPSILFRRPQASVSTLRVREILARSDGWILTIRRRNALSIGHVARRIKPASTTSSTPASRNIFASSFSTSGSNRVEIGQGASMRWESKIPALCRNLAHPGRPTLATRASAARYAERIRSRIARQRFLFLIREFQLAAVSLPHPGINDTRTSLQ